MCVYILFYQWPVSCLPDGGKSSASKLLKSQSQEEGERGGGARSNVYHIFQRTHTHTHTYIYTPFTSRGAPWLPWNFNVDQLVYLGCEIALNTNTLTHVHTHTHTQTHTLAEDQREFQPCTAALLLLPLAKWTTKHSRLSSQVISGLQPNEDGLCL